MHIQMVRIVFITTNAALTLLLQKTDTLTPLVTKSSKVGFIMQDKPVLTDPLR
jgi:hypothetical protein